MPFGTILEPIFASPTSDQIVGYTRAGDSAIWTGHYLAAEAFRHAATGSRDALRRVRAALRGIRALVDVTGTDLLARAAVPVDAPEADRIITEEASNGIYRGVLANRSYYWIGDTSRDQYSGVFFGLGAAYDLLAGQPRLQSEIRTLVTRLLDFLLRNQWTVVMPDGKISTLFITRPDQKLAFLQIGRHVDPARFGATYTSERGGLALTLFAPISVDTLDDHGSYHKFNLDVINLYNLVRLEDDPLNRFLYSQAYDVLRRTVDDHGNAHFNMIDRALKGARAERDAETRDLLEAWLRRPSRDERVDWRGTLAACGEDRACNPIPVADRVRTDFLWQRSPFLLYGGGDGFIETSAIDYILPYWMARYYGVIEAPAQPASTSGLPGAGGGRRAPARP